MDLTIRYVDQVKSNRLRQVLMKILGKLALALESSMVKVLGRGWIVAARLSGLAVGWGNELAYGWRDDLGFQRELGSGALGDGHCSV